MIIRVGAAILIVTVIALAAVRLEKQNLELRRGISLQHEWLPLLEEKRSRLLLTTQELGSPARLLEERERLRQQELKRSRKSPDLRAGLPAVPRSLRCPFRIGTERRMRDDRPEIRWAIRLGQRLKERYLLRPDQTQTPCAPNPPTDGSASGQIPEPLSPNIRAEPDRVPGEHSETNRPVPPAATAPFDSRSAIRRERLLPLWLLGVGLVLLGRLLHVQLLARETFASRAHRQQISEETVPARPGDLYDRAGRLLATTLTTASVYVNPRRLDPDGDIPVRLAGILEMDPVDLVRQIRSHRDRHFLWIQRRISDEAALAIQRLKLPPDLVGLRTEQKRHYPQGAIAAHVIGLRDIDGHGRGGAEEAFQNLLSGQDGSRRYVRDARGYIIDVLEEVTREPQDGTDVTLTIDAVLQMQTEEQLDVLCRKHQPLGACAIVLDPRTGEVLAMASRPGVDPNRPETAADSAWKNLALSAVFEPGSTFKPLVVAWGLHHHLLGQNEMFDCELGAYRMGRRVLHDHHRYGRLSLTDVLVKSSNIGMAKIGERLGNDELYALATAYGFGRRTGIELPGELPGLVRPRADWDSYSTGSIPMGQEIAATPLQMITAHAVLANGGTWITPHVLLSSDRRNPEMGDPRASLPGAVAAPSDHAGPKAGASSREELSRGVSTAAPQSGHIPAGSVTRTRIIDDEVARWVIEEPMVQVVERGTGKLARIDGRNVFGKTGTAQKTNLEKAGYSSSRHISSFLCGAPAENPRLMVIVTVDEPSGAEQFGGSVAAPYAREILSAGLEREF